MSRSATPATRNEATTRLQPPKRTTSAELPIGTAIRGSRERLRTVADGCERLRTVANGCDRERNVERTHPQPPDPQSETGTLATHSGKAPQLVVVQKRMHEKNMDNLSMEAPRHKYEVSLWIWHAVNAVECQEIEHKKWI